MYDSRPDLDPLAAHANTSVFPVEHIMWKHIQASAAVFNYMQILHLFALTYRQKASAKLLNMRINVENVQVISQ